MDEVGIPRNASMFVNLNGFRQILCINVEKRLSNNSPKNFVCRVFNMMIQEDSVLWTHQTFSWGGLGGIADWWCVVLTHFLCFILSSCHVSLVYFSREAMNFTAVPSSVWLSQHVLHRLTCKLRTWMVYSNSICSLVSGIEMGIGKTRLSLPHSSMSSSMVFLNYYICSKNSALR